MMKYIFKNFLLPLYRSFLMIVGVFLKHDEIVAIIVASFVLIVAIYPTDTPAVARFLATCLIWIFAVAIAAAIVMPLVLFVYHVRSTFRSVYGLTEITFGISSILYALIQLLDGGSTTAAVFAIGGGVYVLIRGLDNIDRLDGDHPVKRWLDSMLAYIKEGRR